MRWYFLVSASQGEGGGRLFVPHFCMSSLAALGSVSVEFGCFSGSLGCRVKAHTPTAHVSLPSGSENKPNKCLCFFSGNCFNTVFSFSFFLFFFLFYPVVTSFQSVALNSWGNGERLANCCFTSTKAAAGFLQGKKPKDLGRLGKGLAIWRRILCSGPCCVVLV